MSENSSQTRQSSLIRQVILISTLICILPAIAIPWLLVKRVSDEVSLELTSKAQTLAAMVLAAANAPDPSQLQQLLALLKNETDLLGCSVQRADGSSVQLANTQGDGKQGRVEGVVISDSANTAYQKAVVILSTARSKERVWTVYSFMRTSGFVIVVGILIVLLMTLAVGRSIVTPVRAATALASAIARGDLSQPQLQHQGDNEIAQLSRAVSTMTSILRGSVGTIRGSSLELVANVEQLSSVTAALASSGSETATAISQVSSTVAEVKQTSEHARQKTGQIVDAAQLAIDIADRGRSSVESSRAQFNAIRDQVVVMAEHIRHLYEDLRVVDSVITGVNEIANQSNLLAVNAAVEASKAGEFGAGFRVVAQEVKLLSQQSKQSTEAVRQTLQGIRKAVEKLSAAANEGSSLAEQGVQRIAETDQIISTLRDIVGDATTLATGISLNANEQLIGLDQISTAMQSIRQAADDNMLGAEQVNDGAQRLKTISNELEALVARFKLPEA